MKILILLALSLGLMACRPANKTAGDEKIVATSSSSTQPCGAGFDPASLDNPGGQEVPVPFLQAGHYNYVNEEYFVSKANSGSVYVKTDQGHSPKIACLNSFNKEDKVTISNSLVTDIDYNMSGAIKLTGYIYDIAVFGPRDISIRLAKDETFSEIHSIAQALSGWKVRIYKISGENYELRGTFTDSIHGLTHYRLIRFSYQIP